MSARRGHRGALEVQRLCIQAPTIFVCPASILGEIKAAMSTAAMIARLAFPVPYECRWDENDDDTLHKATHRAAASVRNEQVLQSDQS